MRSGQSLMASSNRFDVSIGLYDVSESTLYKIREFLLRNLPLETDISITPSVRSTVSLGGGVNHDDSD